MFRILAIGSLVLFIGVPLQAATPDPINPDPNTARPIDAVDTVFIEDMTWMEVRDAMRSGKRTVIVATGGVEQNGPYLVTGKHSMVLRATTEKKIQWRKRIVDFRAHSTVKAIRVATGPS